jgi:hypothetical protein
VTRGTITDLSAQLTAAAGPTPTETRCKRTTLRLSPNQGNIAGCDCTTSCNFAHLVSMIMISSDLGAIMQQNSTSGGPHCSSAAAAVRWVSPKAMKASGAHAAIVLTHMPDPMSQGVSCCASNKHKRDCTARATGRSSGGDAEQVCRPHIQACTPLSHNAGRIPCRQQAYMPNIQALSAVAPKDLHMWGFTFPKCHPSPIKLPGHLAGQSA